MALVLVAVMARRARMRKVFMVDLRWQLLDWLLNCVLVVIVDGWMAIQGAYLFIIGNFVA
jgi:hypothetical protein